MPHHLKIAKQAKKQKKKKTTHSPCFIINKIMWDLLHISWYSRRVYLALIWNAVDFYGAHMAAFYCAQLNCFKPGLTFWSGNPLFNVSSLGVARHTAPEHCPQTAVSNIRLSQQYLVREPFRLLMARPTSQFRELIKAVWCRSWGCTMSLTDPKLSKIRNAQLVAFIGPINMH